MKRHYRAGGLPNALEEPPHSGQPTKITPALEAHLTRLTCSEVPAGEARWTLQLLTDRVVELRYVNSISDETVRKILKRANSSLGSSKCGALAR